MRCALVLLGLAAVLQAPTAGAIDADDLEDLVGYTIVASTNVEDEFEGCDFDKKIKLDNGWTLTCSSYSYSYSYRPEVIIFAKELRYQGRVFWDVKALIDDDLYDMQPLAAR